MSDLHQFSDAEEDEEVPKPYKVTRFRHTLTSQLKINFFFQI